MAFTAEEIKEDMTENKLLSEQSALSMLTEIYIQIIEYEIALRSSNKDTSLVLHAPLDVTDSDEFCITSPSRLKRYKFLGDGKVENGVIKWDFNLFELLDRFLTQGFTIDHGPDTDTFWIKWP